MTILTVTAKGQVTLRKDILRHLGVEPGDKLDVDILPDSRIIARAAKPKGRISDAFDFLKRKGAPTLSIAEISRIAGQGWTGKR